MLEPNPVLKKLGFSPNDRLAIIHTDDIGMCQASVAAFAELFDFGLISCGATMVPCPWFLEAAAFCRTHPQVDMGVHLTLTSEWAHYRWRPLSTCDPASGLLDEEGYFPREVEPVQQKADPSAVQIEMAAQVSRALQAGIQVTHIDTHMGTVAHQKFIPAYVQLATQHGIVPMIPRQDEAGYQAMGLDDEMANFAAQFVHTLEEQGVPLLDQLSGLELDKPEDRLEQAKAAFSALKPGITHFIIHPSVDTPELRAITPDWPSRVADYQTFMSQELKDFINNLGIQIIGYQPLSTLMRKP